MVSHLMSDQLVLDVEDFVALIAVQLSILVVDEDVLLQPGKEKTQGIRIQLTLKFRDEYIATLTNTM